MTTGSDAPSGGNDPFLGTTLEGRYRILSKLGGGGMGTAYLADDLRLSRRVVVKVPHPKFLAEEGFRARFEHEIRSLTTLSHPHIVKVFDSGSVGDVPFAVLEYLPGGSLKDRLVRVGGSMSAGEIVEWLPAVAGALDFIHEQGVIHRDVKPGNVLFDAKGHVFLADFGIAKALGAADTGLTQTGMTPGSPDYMAPEVTTGDGLEAPYDQYALAVVVYEALTKRLPHTAPTPIALLTRKATTPAPNLGPIAPHVPEGVRAAVMRALSMNPADRFPTCDAFASAVVFGCAARNAEAVVVLGTETKRAVGSSDEQGARGGGRAARKQAAAADVGASSSNARRDRRPMLAGFALIVLSAAGLVAWRLGAFDGRGGESKSVPSVMPSGPERAVVPAPITPPGLPPVPAAPSNCGTARCADGSRTARRGRCPPPTGRIRGDRDGRHPG